MKTWAIRQNLYLSKLFFLGPVKQILAAVFYFQLALGPWGAYAVTVGITSKELPKPADQEQEQTNPFDNKDGFFRRAEQLFTHLGLPVDIFAHLYDESSHQNLDEKQREILDITRALEEGRLKDYVDSHPKAKEQLDYFLLTNQHVHTNITSNGEERVGRVIHLDNYRINANLENFENMDVEVSFDREDRQLVFSGKRGGQTLLKHVVSDLDIIDFVRDQHLLFLVDKKLGPLLVSMDFVIAHGGMSPIPFTRIPNSQAIRQFINAKGWESSRLSLEFIRPDTDLAFLPSEIENSKSFEGKPLVTYGDLVISRVNSDGTKELIQYLPYKDLLLARSFTRHVLELFIMLVHPELLPSPDIEGVENIANQVVRDMETQGFDSTRLMETLLSVSISRNSFDKLALQLNGLIEIDKRFSGQSIPQYSLFLEQHQKELEKIETLISETPVTKSTSLSKKNEYGQDLEEAEKKRRYNTRRDYIALQKMTPEEQQKRGVGVNTEMVHLLHEVYNASPVSQVAKKAQAKAYRLLASVIKMFRHPIQSAKDNPLKSMGLGASALAFTQHTGVADFFTYFSVIFNILQGGTSFKWGSGMEYMFMAPFSTFYGYLVLPVMIYGFLSLSTYFIVKSLSKVGKTVVNEGEKRASVMRAKNKQFISQLEGRDGSVKFITLIIKFYFTILYPKTMRIADWLGRPNYFNARNIGFSPNKKIDPSSDIGEVAEISVPTKLGRNTRFFSWTKRGSSEDIEQKKLIATYNSKNEHTRRLAHTMALSSVLAEKEVFNTADLMLPFNNLMDWFRNNSQIRSFRDQLEERNSNLGMEKTAAVEEIRNLRKAFANVPNENEYQEMVNESKVKEQLKELQETLTNLFGEKIDDAKLRDILLTSEENLEKVFEGVNDEKVMEIQGEMDRFSEKLKYQLQYVAEKLHKGMADDPELDIRKQHAEELPKEVLNKYYERAKFLASEVKGFTKIKGWMVQKKMKWNDALIENEFHPYRNWFTLATPQYTRLTDNFGNVDKVFVERARNDFTADQLGAVVLPVIIGARAGILADFIDVNTLKYGSFASYLGRQHGLDVLLNINGHALSGATANVIAFQNTKHSGVNEYQDPAFFDSIANKKMTPVEYLRGAMEFSFIKNAGTQYSIGHAMERGSQTFLKMMDTRLPIFFALYIVGSLLEGRMPSLYEAILAPSIMYATLPYLNNSLWWLVANGTNALNDTMEANNVINQNLYVLFSKLESGNSEGNTEAYRKQFADVVIQTIDAYSKKHNANDPKAVQNIFNDGVLENLSPGIWNFLKRGDHSEKTYYETLELYEQRSALHRELSNYDPDLIRKISKEFKEKIKAHPPLFNLKNLTVDWIFNSFLVQMVGTTLLVLAFTTKMYNAEYTTLQNLIINSAVFAGLWAYLKKYYQDNITKRHFLFTPTLSSVVIALSHYFYQSLSYGTPLEDMTDELIRYAIYGYVGHGVAMLPSKKYRVAIGKQARQIKEKSVHLLRQTQAGVCSVLGIGKGKKTD